MYMYVRDKENMIRTYVHNIIGKSCQLYILMMIKKGHIGIVEKVQETSSDTGMHNRAITVLHEQ